MFQRGQRYLKATSYVDAITLRRAGEVQSIEYLYVVRYPEETRTSVRSGEGTFDGPLTAREAALRSVPQCAGVSAVKCRFNFTPAGGCIGIVRPPRPPGSSLVWHVVSKPQLTAEEAALEAMNSCRVIAMRGVKKVAAIGNYF